MDNKKYNAFESYNIIADWYVQNRYPGLMEKDHLDRLMGVVGKGAAVLDLGCGTGMPMMQYLLQQGMNVTGVDASHKMLEIARSNFPSTPFIQADMRELSLGQQFDAIIAWHSFFHLPAEDQPAMFRIFKEHLNNNGILLFTSGTEQGEAWSVCGGEDMFHGSLDRAHYQSLLEEHHFQLLLYKEDDPGCGGANVWMAQLTAHR